MTPEDDLEAVRTERNQLRTALASRIVIEQAKGVLFERYKLTIDEAFDVMRRAARRNRITLSHVAAATMASNTTTPRYISDELDRLVTNRDRTPHSLRAPR
jgi:AmiR/NasT family two-component response regulator